MGCSGLMVMALDCSAKSPGFKFHPVSNSQGRNLGRSVTPARTSGLSSIQGDLGESGKVIFIIRAILLKESVCVSLK